MNGRVADRVAEVWVALPGGQQAIALRRGWPVLALALDRLAVSAPRRSHDAPRRAESVARAWCDPGPVPAYHDQWVRRVRQVMPDLAGELDAISREQGLAPRAAPEGR